MGISYRNHSSSLSHFHLSNFLMDVDNAREHALQWRSLPIAVCCRVKLAKKLRHLLPDVLGKDLR